jgi:iron complex transport system permease protein
MAAGGPVSGEDVLSIGLRLPPKPGRWLVPALAAVCALLAAASLVSGPVSLSAAAFADVLLGRGDDIARTIVLEIRLPRTVLALSIGATFGLLGAALQGMLRNPLSDPSLFGAPPAAAVGAVTVLSLGAADALSFWMPAAAIAGAFVSVFLLLAVAGPRAGMTTLILAGLAVSSLASALTSLALNLAPNPYAALEIAFWLLGSLEDRSAQHVVLALPFMLVAWAMVARDGPAFRALALGEEAAASLGVRLQALRLRVVLATAFGVGAAVAVAGAIGFVGLVAPHLVRPMVGHDPARVLLPSALTGAALLTASDILVRFIPSTGEIKLGVVTALIGVPFFLVLIARHRRLVEGGF